MSTLAQRSFSGGEIAPALYARTDVIKYQTGVRTLRNFFVMRHGGAATRPGTSFVGEVKDSTKRVRLIPFVFNSDQTYVLEFGDSYVRVIKNGAYIKQSTKTITGITQASPAVVTSAAHGYSNGDEVYIASISGMTELNGRNFKIAGVTANTYQLNYLDGTAVDSTALTAYVSGGTSARIYTITANTYAEAHLQDIQYIQSADVVTLVHPSYKPRELTRSADDAWTLTDITIAPSIGTTTVNAPTGTAGANTYQWQITAVDAETFEEGGSSGRSGSGLAPPTVANPITLTWSAVTGAGEYNIYREVNGVPGLIGTARGTTFSDTGLTPDTTDTPPSARNPFATSGNYPSTVAYIQQRLMFANTDNDPEKIWASQTGNFHNFTTSSPIQDDDSITFTIAGRQVNEVRHLLDIGRMAVFTTGGEWTLEGDEAGILRPTAINPKQHGYNGASSLAPLVLNTSALYVQARGSIVRDLAYDQDGSGYKGNDLTVFSAHLFDGYTITDWAYQQIPHSVVWAVRDDGTLLGLTYLREHQVAGWHRHDFDGTVENVCSIPDGNEDAVYLVIKRSVDGRTVRYVERMPSRQVTAETIADYIGMDSAISYDGRNTTATTMTVSEYLAGGYGYAAKQTLTASALTFLSTDVGNQIHLTGDDGEVIRFTITDYVSATVVRGRPHKDTPASLQAEAVTDWARAVDELTNLWHLEGKDVSVFADGFVVASPNNDAYEVLTVEDGAITLDKPYAVIHVGLPVTADIETLDIDTPSGESMVDKLKIITKVSVFVESSRGMWVGPKAPSDDDEDPLENLSEEPMRNDEGLDDPVELTTGSVDITIAGEFSKGGRIFIRQVDPLPLAVLSIAPSGLFPMKGGQ